MAERQQAVAQVLLHDEAVASVASLIGVDGVNPSLNTGRLLITLKPLDERGVGITQVMRRLQNALQAVEGMTVYLQALQDLTLENRVSRTQYQLSLQAVNAEELSVWTQRLVAQLSQSTVLADVNSDVQNQGLQAYVEIDRSTASRLGVSVAAVDNALYNAFGQRMISTVYTQANQYRVVLEVKPEYRQGLEALQRLRIPSSHGGDVPLLSFAKTH